MSTFGAEHEATGTPRASARPRSGILSAVGLSLGLHAALLAALAVGAWTIDIAGGSAVGDPGVASSVVELSAAPVAPRTAAPVTDTPAAPPPLTIALGDGPGAAGIPAPKLVGERPAAGSSAAITGLSAVPTQTTLRSDAVAAPGAIFAGVGTSSARSIVYAVDASGPMVGALPEVFAELRASVERLKPTQKFAVIVFRRTPDGAGQGFESFVGAPVRATDEAKRELATWLDAIRPSGRSNPLQGLTAALAMSPDAVFLLSRSIERSGGGVWDLGKDRTLAELDRLNPRGSAGNRRVAIRTIQFIDEDPTGTMQAIAREHAGSDAVADSTPDAGGDGAYTVIRRAGELTR